VHIEQIAQDRLHRREVRGEVVECGVMSDTYDFMTVLAFAEFMLLLNQVAPYF
jgi:hypothetical protein